MTILHKDFIESPEKILKKVIAFLNVNEIENSESTKYFKLHKKKIRSSMRIYFVMNFQRTLAIINL